MKALIADTPTHPSTFLYSDCSLRRIFFKKYMCGKIYNVDLEKEITPLEVRDAMVECFLQAHAEVLESM